MSIDGVLFSDAWEKRVDTDFDGVPALFISREDLLANKKATARPQDLIDAQNLILAEKVSRNLRED